MDFVAIDFETTAYLDGGKNEPYQLGLAKVMDGTIVETREWFFGTEQTPDYPPMMSLWEEYYPYLTNTPLVAHNIATERTILTRLAPLTRWGPWTDTLKVAKKRYPNLPSYKLGDLCTMFDCVPIIENRTWHDGLYDAVACAMLALRIL